MKNLVRIFSLSLALLVVGCATAENYKAALESWVGATESQLVSGWGVPDGVYNSGGYKYLAYKRSSTSYVSGTSPTYTTQIIGNTAYTTSVGGSSGYMITSDCKTTFTLKNGVVIGWRGEGNDCTSL